MKRKHLSQLLLPLLLLLLGLAGCAIPIKETKAVK